MRTYTLTCTCGFRMTGTIGAEGDVHATIIREQDRHLLAQDQSYESRKQHAMSGVYSIAAGIGG